MTVCAGGWDLGAAGSVGAEAVCCGAWVSRLATFRPPIGWRACACMALAWAYVAGVRWSSAWGVPEKSSIVTPHSQDEPGGLLSDCVHQGRG